jgi:hypothetical protein
LWAVLRLTPKRRAASVTDRPALRTAWIKTVHCSGTGAILQGTGHLLSEVQHTRSRCYPCPCTTCYPSLCIALVCRTRGTRGLQLVHSGECRVDLSHDRAGDCRPIFGMSQTAGCRRPYTDLKTKRSTPDPLDGSRRRPLFRW